jgi:hypothetical protein
MAKHLRLCLDVDNQKCRIVLAPIPISHYIVEVQCHCFRLDGKNVELHVYGSMIILPFITCFKKYWLYNMEYI